MTRRENKGKGRPIWAAFFAIGVAIFGPVTAFAQTDEPESTQDLSPAQARAIARAAVQQGNLGLANVLSSALLQRDPDDAEALLIRAIVARAAGDLDTAGASARDAFRNSDNPALKFDAAMLAADIDNRRERFTRAQIWLRRADQVAPDEQRQALAARSYNQVAQANPLKVQLRFAAKPSNNVNNGAETTEIEIGGIPGFSLAPEDQQLSGFEASTGVSLRYRLSEDRDHKTEALGEVFYRKVWLSSDAKDKAPDAEGSDYDYGVVIAGLQHQRLIWPDIGPSRVTGTVGRSWYGGDPLSNFVELSLGQTVARGQNAALTFGLTARDENRQDDEINDSVTLALSADYARRLESGGRVSFGATIKDVDSESGTVNNFAVGLRAGQTFARIGPVIPAVSATLEHRDYRNWQVTADGREDISLGLNLNLTWPDISYYGFVPQMSLAARRTWSDVDIYDRNELSVGLTAVSRF